MLTRKHGLKTCHVVVLLYKNSKQEFLLVHVKKNFVQVFDMCSLENKIFIKQNLSLKLNVNDNHRQS